MKIKIFKNIRNRIISKSLILSGKDKLKKSKIILGDLVEIAQNILGQESGHDSEDPYSNIEGARFGKELDFFTIKVNDQFIH